MNAEALSGKVLGTCTLQTLIGRGGMGAVFLAQQSRPRRQVAVKVLLPMLPLQPYQQAAFLKRFRRETDAIALLVHPNIVPVHEYGEQDGLAYLVMPYISGGTLRDELEREGKLSLTQTVSYLEQMSAALNFAHERGVIHRDIKPANILLTPTKRLVLTDFGLVKIITEEQRDQTPLSGPGMPMGTPDYMSPEQVVGGEIDARADLYSLGVILYQMLTGIVPFTGEMPMKVAMHHLHTPPPSPRTLRPDLPPSAESVVLRALAKKPEDRYACTYDLARAFRQALEAAGVVLADSMSNTASLRTVKKDRNMNNRQRSLFDPLWRGDQSQQAQNQLRSPKQEDEMENQPTNELPRQDGGRSLPYEQNQLRPKGRTRLLGEDWGNNAINAQNPVAPQGWEQASALNPTTPASAGMFNPTDKGGLLRSYNANGQTNAQESNPPEVADSFNPYNPAPSATGMLKTQTGALIPISPAGATGALMVPSDNEGSGQTGMLKLTQSVKVVKVAVPGQPGQYVTGLLPVVPSAMGEIGRSGQQETTSPKGRMQKNIWVVILITAVVLLLFGSVIVLVTRLHSPASTTSHSGTLQHNDAATVTAQASATALANIIVADPLTSNIHDWPSTPDGTGNDAGNYTFGNGGYHIKATSDKNDAVALLPNLSVSDKFVYTISLNEVSGLDNSTDAKKVNTFGLLFRLSQPDDQHLSYYAFLIDPNSAKPIYEFQKYDSTQQPDPRTTLWKADIGGEYHLDHGVNNVIKISADGAHLTFNVNGKDVGSKDDGSLTSGLVGMIVNLKDTEIAFSNLLLTKH
jgi:serine/threonine protein kinase